MNNNKEPKNEKLFKLTGLIYDPDSSKITSLIGFQKEAYPTKQMYINKDTGIFITNNSLALISYMKPDGSVNLIKCRILIEDCTIESSVNTDIDGTEIASYSVPDISIVGEFSDVFGGDTLKISSDDILVIVPFINTSEISELPSLKGNYVPITGYSTQPNLIKSLIEEINNRNLTEESDDEPEFNSEDYDIDVREMVGSIDDINLDSITKEYVGIFKPTVSEVFFKIHNFKDSRRIEIVAFELSNIPNGGGCIKFIVMSDSAVSVEITDTAIANSVLKTLNTVTERQINFNSCKFKFDEDNKLWKVLDVGLNHKNRVYVDMDDIVCLSTKIFKDDDRTRHLLLENGCMCLPIDKFLHYSSWTDLDYNVWGWIRNKIVTDHSPFTLSQTGRVTHLTDQCEATDIINTDMTETVDKHMRGIRSMRKNLEKSFHLHLDRFKR